MRSKETPKCMDRMCQSKSARAQREIYGENISEIEVEEKMIRDIWRYQIWMSQVNQCKALKENVDTQWKQNIQFLY